MSIVDNRKAFHEYFIEERYEAGIALEGWEVKAIRGGRAHIREAYVRIMGQNVVLIGCTITPMPEASTHVIPDPMRSRKLLLHRQEINRLIGKVEQKGYTLVPVNLHYKEGLIKLEIGLAKGKKMHDKREATKERDWKVEQQRIMKTNTKRGN